MSLPLLLLAFFLLTPTHRRVLLEPRWQPGLSHSSATLSLDQLLTSAQHPHLHSVFCSLPTERKKEFRQWWEKKRENRSRSWREKKRKEKRMPLNVSYATIALLQIASHFHWRQRSSAHRSGYSCLETIAGVLLRQLLSCCGADAFFLSLANQFNTDTSPLLLRAGFGSSVFKWHEAGVHCSFDSLRTEEISLQKVRRPNQGLITSEVGSAWGGGGIGGEHTTAVWEEPLFFCRGNYISESVKNRMRIWNIFFFVQDRITKGREGGEMAICFWLLSLASLEPGWAGASKCQSDKDQAWQTYTGVLSFHVSSLLLASPIFACLKSPDKGCRDERHVV